MAVVLSVQRFVLAAQVAGAADAAFAAVVGQRWLVAQLCQFSFQVSMRSIRQAIDFATGSGNRLVGRG